MAQLEVDLGSRSYPIFIDTDTCHLTTALSSYLFNANVVVVTNPTVAEIYLQPLIDRLTEQLSADHKVTSCLIPDGEQYKNLDVFNDVNTFLLEGNYGRDTTLIALGGGVVGDLCGFVAACYQRGIDFIQYPTTLLSQVDSSVGGKTAINHPLGKNMVGAFYQPKAVVIDVNSLTTLPKREFAAGIAEVIKYGVANDGAFFDWLEANKASIAAMDSEALTYVIKRCCEIKADIVRQDEKEGGVRALLNFGHTFGHAIEAHMGYGQWLHGEAVAAGMVFASKVAQLHGFLTADQVERVVSLLQYFELPVEGPDNMGYLEYMPHMQKDKKTLAGEIRFVIPTSLGSSKVMSNVTKAQLEQVLGVASV
jgi:3-dehydroquinate synthase